MESFLSSTPKISRWWFPLLEVAHDVWWFLLFLLVCKTLSNFAVSTLGRQQIVWPLSHQSSVFPLALFLCLNLFLLWWRKHSRWWMCLHWRNISMPVLSYLTLVLLEILFSVLDIHIGVYGPPAFMWCRWTWSPLDPWEPATSFQVCMLKPLSLHESTLCSCVSYRLLWISSDVLLSRWPVSAGSLSCHPELLIQLW